MVLEWGYLEVAPQEYWLVWVFFVEKFCEPAEYGVVFKLSLRCGWLW